MTIEPAIAERCYDIHGIGVTVSSEEPAVLEAMDFRLRDFGREAMDFRLRDFGREAAIDAGAVRLEFVAAADHRAPPDAQGRAVYDTPYGSLHYYPAADVLGGELAGVGLRCEPGSGVATFTGTHLTGRQLYLATHPLATISLMELLERRGRFSLHAGCVATAEGNGILLAGPSGAGKSTLTLALTRAGMSFLSDDVVFLAREENGTTRVLGFADTVGVTDHIAERFGELRPMLDDPPTPGFPKRLRRIEELFGAPALSACTPAALVFPEVARDEPSRIAPLDPKEALLRLVPDVLLTEPGATQAHLRAIAEVLDRVRCYTLRSGTDLERAVELVGATVT